MLPLHFSPTWFTSSPLLLGLFPFGVQTCSGTLSLDHASPFRTRGADVACWLVVPVKAGIEVFFLFVCLFFKILVYRILVSLPGIKPMPACSGSTDSQPPDCQGSPQGLTFDFSPYHSRSRSTYQRDEVCLSKLQLLCWLHIVQWRDDCLFWAWTTSCFHNTWS